MSEGIIEKHDSSQKEKRKFLENKKKLIKKKQTSYTRQKSMDTTDEYEPLFDWSDYGDAD